MKFIDFEKLAALFLKYWDKFLIDGVSYTLALAAITVAFGAVFASVLALMKMSKIPPLRWLSTIYIEIIRGTPMLLQLYFFGEDCVEDGIADLVSDLIGMTFGHRLRRKHKGSVLGWDGTKLF